MAVSIEKKYQKLTDTEHVLLRPGMYIGSVKPHTEEVYLLDRRSWKLVPKELTYNPGFLKLFDEIVSNSVDEHKRNPKLNQVKVNIDIKTNKISIWDNGGIPVEIHKENNEWVPEMIFSNLKTGSNFDDTEERTVVGTNVVGSTLTNIFSKEFTIDTCDKKKRFTQTFSNNMAKKTKPAIKPQKKGFTEISYIADFKRFGMSKIDKASIQMIEKRLYDIAACNPKLKIWLNEDPITFKSFKEYSELYTTPVFYEQSENWQIGIGHSTSGFKAISFVNSVETKDGGKHVDNITWQITQFLRDKIKRKHRVDVKPSELKNHLYLFINSTIINPAFSSQTKEKLITEPKDFGSIHVLSDKTLRQVLNSEIIQSVLDWIKQKQAADERSKLRKLNYKTGTVLKDLKLADEYFGEGLTILNNKVYQLTWQKGTGFVYDVNTFEKLSSFRYGNSKEGWGLCNYNNIIYKSDGTEKIWLLNSETLVEQEYIQVYTNKGKIIGINEMEWIDGKIYANRYQKDGVAIINPKNGAVIGVVDFKPLKKLVTQHEGLDVLNGIAYNPKTKTIFVTGKRWDKLFEVEIIEK